RYPGATTLGEISSEDSLATTAEYVNPQRLHMGYSFELLTNDFSAAYIRGTVERLEAAMTDGWPCWAVSNHDVQRAVTRWGGANPGPDFARMLVALVCSLRGSVCLYQGEELGLPEADVPFEALQDPYGVTFWPNFKGRDGCRTPMPWDGSALAGFTVGRPWLPVPAEHRALNVEAQDTDPHSVLNATRRFLRWRGHQPARRHGSIRFVDTNEPVPASTHASPPATPPSPCSPSCARASAPSSWRCSPSPRPRPRCSYRRSRSTLRRSMATGSHASNATHAHWPCPRTAPGMARCPSTRWTLVFRHEYVCSAASGRDAAPTIESMHG